MHVHVIGGGLAGALLAWRLAHRSDADIVTLSTVSAVPDATAVSGGVVRGFEPDAEQRGLALAGLQELDADPIMRAWSGLRRVPCVYLTDAETPDVDVAVAQVAAARPGSVELVDGSTLHRRGFAGWTGRGVWEHGAGVVDPARWRSALLAGLERRPGVHVVRGAGEPATVSEADITVVAAGAWTPALLRRLGHPEDRYRTKAVDYTVFDADGPTVPSFVDESTGLYGRPVDGGVLLGRATDDWHVEPGVRAPSPHTIDHLRELARERLPHLRLLDVRRQVAAADCYAVPPVLRLRTVAPGLRTFTGGSGGAAKTALAASARAADALTGAPTAAHGPDRSHPLDIVVGTGDPGVVAPSSSPIPTGRSPRP